MRALSQQFYRKAPDVRQTEIFLPAYFSSSVFLLLIFGPSLKLYDLFYFLCWNFFISIYPIFTVLNPEQRQTPLNAICYELDLITLSLLLSSHSLIHAYIVFRIIIYFNYLGIIFFVISESMYELFSVSAVFIYCLFLTITVRLRNTRKTFNL